MDWSVGAFEDLRLTKRGARSSNKWWRAKTVCLKRLGGDRAGEEAAGRFFANDTVTVDKIIDSWSQHTGPAAEGRCAGDP